MRLAGCPTHSALVDDAHPAGSSAPIAAKPVLSVRFGRLGRSTALGRQREFRAFPMSCRLPTKPGPWKSASRRVCEFTVPARSG